MNITKGIVNRPTRTTIYGPEGIGKSTLASRWPAPLFIDMEGGTHRLDVARVSPVAWAQVVQTIQELTVRGKNDNYQTIVFDTADWLEKSLSASIVAEHNWRSLETPGFGKGYAMLGEDSRKFLDSVTAMQEATGRHVVFIAHGWLRKQELPDEAGAFDRWEMKLSKHCAPAFKEWSDLVLFCNYQTILVATDTGKTKAQGQERVMFTTHHACWDAKNRYGLPERLPMTIEALAPVFATAPAPKAEAKPDPKPAQDPTPAPQETKAGPTAAGSDATGGLAATEPVDPEKQGLLRQLGKLMLDSKITKEELGAELHRNKVCPADTNPRDMNVQTLNRIVAKWDVISHNILLLKSKAA